MTENTYIFDRFEYHLEDLDCRVCLHFKSKTKKYINGCREQICRFSLIRHDAIKHGRIKRKRGHFKMQYHHAEKKEESNNEQ